MHSKTIPQSLRNYTVTFSQRAQCGRWRKSNLTSTVSAGRSSLASPVVGQVDSVHIKYDVMKMLLCLCDFSPKTQNSSLIMRKTSDEFQLGDILQHSWATLPQSRPSKPREAWKLSEICCLTCVPRTEKGH